MLVFTKRWTLDLDARDERHLRAIVDMGALTKGRFQFEALIEAFPEHGNVTIDERTILEAALLVGLRVLARDLERHLGTPLEKEGEDQGDRGGPSGRNDPSTQS
jgi:hypothetical protein